MRPRLAKPRRGVKASTLARRCAQAVRSAPMDVPAILLRWLHISGAAFLLGSLLARRLAAPDAGPAAASRAMRAATHVSAGLVVLAGAYNYLQALSAEPPSAYHMVMGMKILLGLAMVGIAEALVSARGAGPVASHARGLALAGALAGLAVVLLAVIAGAARTP